MEIEQEKLFVTRWENENVLISQRLTWLLASQALLFAAYGTLVTKAMDTCREKELFLSDTASLVVVAGRVFSAVALAGIVAAIGAQLTLHFGAVPKRKRLGLHPVTTAIGWVTCGAIPIIFLWAWFSISTPKVMLSDGTCAGAATGAPATNIHRQ